jgi:ribosome biogenesis GTPase / thiamine phosphate phosphatase
MQRARVIRIISNHYTCITEKGDVFATGASGKLRKGVSPMVGDWVDVLHGSDLSVIERVYPRSNQMMRPSVANVDAILVVMSTLKPEFSSLLVDRITWLVRQANIQPVLVVSKWDLLNEKSTLEKTLDEYRKVMPVFTVGKGVDNSALMKFMANKICVLTGQSGVGKSSLINRLDERYTIKTQEISKALGRGKHTTRHVELFPVQQGWIADTPGFSSLDFSHMTHDDLIKCVVEFEPYREKCRFRDCQHLNEPDCAVKKAVEDKEIPLDRYTHYLEVRILIDQKKEIYL